MAWNLEEALNYYQAQGAPRDQNMLIALLREIQVENNGSIPKHCVNTVSQFYSISESFLTAIIKRIPTLRIDETHCLEICAGPNCGKHTALADCAETLCSKNPGTVSLKFISCMRMCGKGPNIKWDGVLYHNATEELIEELFQKHFQ